MEWSIAVVPFSIFKTEKSGNGIDKIKPEQGLKTWFYSSLLFTILQP
jgi:hypothetical protein